MTPPAAYMFMTGPYVPPPSPRPSAAPSMALSVAASGPPARLYASAALPQGGASGPVAFDIQVGDQAPRLWYVAGGSWTGEVPLVRAADGSVPAQTVHVPSYLASISFWDPPGAPLGCTAAVYAGAATAVSFGGADHALKGLTYATLGTSGQLREAMFMNCKALTGVLTSGGFDEVPASAFEGCAGLTMCPLPSSPSASTPADVSLSLGARCFYGCKSMPGNAWLAGLIYTNEVYRVAEDCLAGCDAVNQVESVGLSYLATSGAGHHLVDAAALSGLAKPFLDGTVSDVQSRSGVEFRQGYSGYAGYETVQTKVRFDDGAQQWVVLESHGA